MEMEEIKNGGEIETVAPLLPQYESEKQITNSRRKFFILRAIEIVLAVFWTYGFQRIMHNQFCGAMFQCGSPSRFG